MKTFQYLDTGKRYYLDEMDQLAGIGGKTKEQWEALFQKHLENGDGILSDGEWWQLESESVTTDHLPVYHIPAGTGGIHGTDTVQGVCFCYR